MSVAQLRTVCNHYHISVRNDKGKFLSVHEMRTALNMLNIDTSVLNNRSKISAEQTIDYNTWRKDLNANIILKNNVSMTYIVGKSVANVNNSSLNPLRKLGMNVAAKFKFLITQIYFDQQLILYGIVTEFNDGNIDPEIKKHYPLRKLMKLDFSYMHKHRYAVISCCQTSLNAINTSIINAINVVAPKGFANVGANISKRQPEPIWFFIKPDKEKEECFKNTCTTILRDKGRDPHAKGSSKIHITFNPRFQTFTLYNIVKYMATQPHLFHTAKMFLLLHDSRFNVDDSEVKPRELYDWTTYLNNYGYSARSSVVIYLDVNNIELQVELDSLIKYWTDNGIDDLIKRKSNNLIYNKRLSKSIYYSISQSSDIQETIRDKNSDDKNEYSISTQLKKERDRFCGVKGKNAAVSDDIRCIMDKWGINMEDLCGLSASGKMPRSDLYFYKGSKGEYSPDFYYSSETCTGRRKIRDRLPNYIPDHSRK
jgi:hypothetical protein